MNVNIKDNGAAYCITVDGLIVHFEATLQKAWEHIHWMYLIASQDFTVGDRKVPVREWVEGMRKAGYLE